MGRCTFVRSASWVWRGQAYREVRDEREDDSMHVPYCEQHLPLTGGGSYGIKSASW